MKHFFTLSLFGLLLTGFGQDWAPIKQRNAKESCIKTSEGKTFSFSGSSLLQNLPAAGEESVIQIPLADGKISSFRIKESEVLPQELIEKYNLHAYKGYNTRNTKQKIRLEYNAENGFHAMITGDEETIYIDPIQQNDPSNVSVYYRKDFVAQNKPKISCELHSPSFSAKADYSYLRFARTLASDDVTIKNFRIAIAATKEYTNFHGGTVSKALSAITTTLNRVSGVYEQEVAITFTLVSTNDKVIFTNANTGGLINDDANTLIDQSQTTIDSKIGTANYDIGHTVSTGAGGLAGLGVVCTSSKAEGVTGSTQPINDPYDVDYVCHEIGHQFGCTHTFNSNESSCSGNRSQSTAVEPGSGVTIMGYAGICGSDNLQNNSIPYFHTVSYDNITNFITLGKGKDCGTETQTSNQKPTVSINSTKYTIPKSTPFELTGSATDPNNDGLIYSWEQIDAGSSANSHNTPSGSSPLFRSFPPVNSSNRTFPKLEDILNGSSTIGEILPSYTRSMSYRLTARDQKGGVHHQEVEHNVDGNSGPFKILSPNTSSTKTGNSVLIITWDVANTNNSPVNCSTVDILLSIDGGLNFNQTLLSQTSNDGSAEVTLPNISTSNARIKIKAHDNIFFDINDSDFSIQRSTQPEFVLSSSEKSTNLCDATVKTITISTQPINNFSGTINLSIEDVPNGISASLSSQSVSENGNTVLTIKNNSYVGTSFSIKVKGVNGSITKEEIIGVTIKSAPTSFAITSPTNSSIIGSDVNIEWSLAEGADSYSIYVANNSTQTTPIISQSNIFTQNYIAKGLTQNTTYFLRVDADNDCGVTSSNMSFTTSNCKSYTRSPDLTIISNKTATDILNITDNGIIGKVSITNIKGTHGWVGDLNVTLIHPNSTSITLFKAICDDDQNEDFNLGFNDNAQTANIPCPSTTGLAYQPSTPFSTFNNLNLSGDWELQISDTYDEDDGVLDSWTMEVCFSPLENIFEKSSVEIINLYPNPAQDKLVIKGDITKSSLVLVTNVQGVTLIETILSDTNEIDVSQLAQGIYYLTVNNVTVPFVKE